jgi:hypothetical protein
MSYKIPVGNSQILPNAGIAYELTASNELQKQKVDLTGGYSLTAIAGLEVYIKRIAVGFNVQGPLSQDFADGQTNLRIRGTAHITYVF